MMSLPSEFLTRIAYEKQLSPTEEDILIELFGRNKNRVQVAQALDISESSVSTHLTGIYNKFNISGKGPVKERRLQEHLSERYWRSQLTTDSSSNVVENNLETLVEEVREKTHASIQERCGTIQVLNTTKSLTLGDIYTHVQIFETIPSRRRLELVELLQDFKQSEFSPVEFSRVTQERVPGLDLLRRYSKLIVLGKPGAGKTTFLKYLALQCSQGQLLSQQVPVFITLRDFAEVQEQQSLLDYIAQQFLQSGVKDAAVKGEQLLNQGRVLLLLDGLDEVKPKDKLLTWQRVVKFIKNFNNNNFIITRQMATLESSFGDFKEIEIAPLDYLQIQTFSRNWFNLKDSVKAEAFIEQLTVNQHIKELASHPLLLTLLCLEFEHRGKLNSNSCDVYEEGIELLEQRNAGFVFPSNTVYENLTKKRNQDLLSQIALTTFEQGHYFFRHTEIEEYIGDYIGNLPNAQIDPELLQLDRKRVLQLIEGQQGLLRERAQGIYSFSHLAFHEYFTAREIILASNLETLVNQVTEKRWRQVFLLTASMLRNADELLKLTKAKIDRLFAEDIQLQQFLIWLNQKSIAVKTYQQPAAVRAFYFFRVLNIDLDLDVDLNLDLTRAIDLCLYLCLDLSLCLDFCLDSNLDRTIDRALERALALNLDPELKKALQQLKEQRLNYEEQPEQFQQWRQTNGQAWTEQLRALMIKYRNIGHDWQFTDQQKELLWQYYYVNQLLSDCLHSDCYLSREVREEIEETLFLPIAEIEEIQ
ncbi:MAG: NACHT domain-containing protein [Symploca sp. SIO1C4]|uniref:NACHT domain-containing protein n=1 Tax=Symploca sp. SIO1C4 TaxID=2607765 RepID=A0A6B3NHW3_9CYAN|nr:NACHT domain-containing protein [Symploca sp. SIO1C4]